MLKDKKCQPVLRPDFQIPYIAGQTFQPGPQPYNPGESASQQWAELAQTKGSFEPTPWPRAVAVLQVLSTNPGTPATRGEVPVNDQYAPLLENFLIFGGFEKKSRG